jgi:hypothetical protein
MGNNLVGKHPIHHHGLVEPTNETYNKRVKDTAQERFRFRKEGNQNQL